MSTQPTQRGHFERPQTAADLLTALDQALAAATPGPWEWEPETSGWDDCGPNLVTVEKCPPYPDGSVGALETVIGAWGHDAWGISVNAADAALIVAAVNALPKLTAAVRAALTLADELESDARTDRDTVLWVTAAFRAALSAPLAQPTTEGCGR